MRACEGFARICVEGPGSVGRPWRPWRRSRWTVDRRKNILPGLAHGGSRSVREAASKPWKQRTLGRGSRRPSFWWIAGVMVVSGMEGCLA